MATNIYVEDAGQESEVFLEVRASGSRLGAGRWPRIALALTSSIAIVAAVALFSRTPAHELVSPSSVVGLASQVQYEDLGRGKCLLKAGGDPKNKWKGSGDVKTMCDADSNCVGYSVPSTGRGGLLWLEGPIKGGGGNWGNCKCFRKLDAIAVGHEVVTPPPPPPVKEASGPVAEKFVSAYYIKTGMCPEDEQVESYSDCVNNFAQLMPDKVWKNSNREYVDEKRDGGCMLNQPTGVWYNKNLKARVHWSGSKFVCKKKQEDMPDFEAMKDDLEKLTWYCLKKTNSFASYKQCMNEITEDKHA